jgi:hypothetical protein
MDSGCQNFSASFSLTFPDDKRSPSQSPKPGQLSLVFLAVFVQFDEPVSDITFWNSCYFATRRSVFMPKASMDKNNFLPPAENEIWLPG